MKDLDPEEYGSLNIPNIFAMQLEVSSKCNECTPPTMHDDEDDVSINLHWGWEVRTESMATSAPRVNATSATKSCIVKCGQGRSVKVCCTAYLCRNVDEFQSLLTLVRHY
eukprot:Blabericola_migrator_1__7144@NODE_3619_length_1630_cov_5_806142_g1087_i3_p2_GENE_NODE_3619_length_1630_cov_5_806142_g1087_i3NODE_3619_length_1630_cov_5_806142_g1087_i3_p2_ORF_typecomplete_len110_score10_65_NODE_3619_length_1630_cov_5_806142_g1087_i3104433